MPRNKITPLPTIEGTETLRSLSQKVFNDFTAKRTKLTHQSKDKEYISNIVGFPMTPWIL